MSGVRSPGYGSFHRCAALPLQVQICRRVRFTVDAPGSSRHLPEAGLRTEAPPAASHRHCWLTLFLPGPLLRAGRTELVVLELDGRSRAAAAARLNARPRRRRRAHVAG